MSDIKAISIPIKAERLREAGAINWMERDLLALIHHLSKQEGRECWAGNEWLAEKMGKSLVYLEKTLSKLRKKGLLETIKFDGRVREMRVLWPAEEVVQNNTIGPGSTLQREGAGPSKKRVRPIPLKGNSENKQTQSRQTASGDGDGSFFDLGQTKSQILAKRLYDAVKEQRPLAVRHAKPSTWDQWFSKLIKTHGESDVTATLDWYVAHLQDEYVPKAASGKAFHAKYQKIKDAIERTEERIKATALPEVKITKLAELMAEDLCNQFHVSELQRKELPIMIQDTLSRSSKFWKTLYAEDNNVTEYITAELGSARAMAHDWWTNALRYCTEYASYTETLLKFRWDPEHKQFLKRLEALPIWKPEHRNTQWWSKALAKSTNSI